MRLLDLFKSREHRANLKRARQGDAEAQFWLGQHTRKCREAFRWYRLAADQGHVQAQHFVGQAYQHGFGVPYDPARAIEEYRISAEQGYEPSQFELGWIYSHSEFFLKEDYSGVPLDYAEAAKWYRLAMEQGNLAAQCNLAGMYRDGEGVPQDRAEAIRLFRLAAEQGYAGARGDLERILQGDT